MVDQGELQREIQALGPWFHNLHLPGGLQTAPQHFLGDFPAFKWQQIAPALPLSLEGWTVLDVGCNAGFYSFELARRGARVVAIDLDLHYLKQARWAARQLQLEDRVEFRQMQVYELARSDETFDLVWFMGVFYHLRYPVLALDILRGKVKQLLMFQTLTTPGEEVITPPDDFSLEERQLMNDPGWPRMAFIERRLAGDPTNWWAPNHACVEALLRSSGFRVSARPTHEAYLCVPQEGDPLGIAHLRQAEIRAVLGQDR